MEQKQVQLDRNAIASTKIQCILTNLQRVHIDVEATIDLIGSAFRWLCVFDVNGFKQQSSDNIPQTAHKCIKN